MCLQCVEAALPAGVDINHVVDIGASKETVWPGLTEPEGLAGWWSTRVSSPPATVGARFYGTFTGDFNPVIGDRWDDELVSFTAQLVAEPAEDGDLVEVEPVTVIGQRMGELVDVPELVERMEAEDPHVRLAADLAAKLEADRDRYLEALTPQASRELVERLAAI